MLNLMAITERQFSLLHKMSSLSLSFVLLAICYRGFALRIDQTGGRDVKVFILLDPETIEFFHSGSIKIRHKIFQRASRCFFIA